MDNEEPKRPPELFDYLQRFIKSDEDGKWRFTWRL
jgi:hypothetical protein